VRSIVRSQTQEHLTELETLPGHRVWVSQASRLIIIDEVHLLCSPGEHRVLSRLLHSPQRVVSFAQLIEGGYHQQDLRAPASLRQTISKVRALVWPCGLDIRCLLGEDICSLRKIRLHAKTDRNDCLVVPVSV